MALSTYTDLQASIASWLHRTDLTAVIPDFVALAEARLNGDLKSRSMEARVTLTCVPGSTVAARYVALPNDMLEMKRLTLMTEPAVALEYYSPDQIVDDSSFLLSAGMPKVFTVVGSNLELAPPPDSNYSLELVYIQKIPPLASNATNWLLTANPNAYLFASLVASTDYTQNDSRKPIWESKYQEAIQTTNSIDWYSGSTMRVKSR